MRLAVTFSAPGSTMFQAMEWMTFRLFDGLAARSSNRVATPEA
jgi:hypothetical protein